MCVHKQSTQQTLYSSSLTALTASTLPVRLSGREALGPATCEEKAMICKNFTGHLQNVSLLALPTSLLPQNSPKGWTCSRTAFCSLLDTCQIFLFKDSGLLFIYLFFRNLGKVSLRKYKRNRQKKRWTEGKNTEAGLCFKKNKNKLPTQSFFYMSR